MTNYIATWFYQESEDEASFYPQLGDKGSSKLVHSIYMQIQIPFFTTFKHYNPEAKLLFFSNLGREAFPPYLTRLFDRLDVTTIKLAYAHRPPKGWYGAWQNQFYLYDILQFMKDYIATDDVLLVCDADCLCRKPLSPLFDAVRKEGSALYEFITRPDQSINGITLSEMHAFYEACYGEQPTEPLAYYGGEFVALRQDVIQQISAAYDSLWQFNLKRAAEQLPKLNEEAHVMSLLAEHLHFRNRIANHYVKRMWTSPQFNNIEPNDVDRSVWHLPYEKKRGLYHLFRYLEKQGGLRDEALFWKKAQALTGIPSIRFSKKIRDRITTLLAKWR